MSVRVMSDVWDYGPADPIENAILLALANHCNDEGLNCYPGIARLAHMARRSPRTVMRAIQELENSGWIKVNRDSFGPKRNGNTYTVNVEKIAKSKHQFLSKRGNKPPVYEALHVTECHVSERHVTERHVTPTTFTHDSGDNPPNPLIGVTIMNRHKPPVVPQGGPPKQSPPSLRASTRNRNPLAPVARQIGEHCGDISRRTLRAITQQLEIDVGRGRSPEDTAKAMKEAWEHLINFAHLLFYKPVPLAFYGNGMWRDDELWQWDQKKREQYRHATQGMR